MYNSSRKRKLREGEYESSGNNQQGSNPGIPFANGGKGSWGMDWITDCGHPSIARRVEVNSDRPVVRLEPVECGKVGSKDKCPGGRGGARGAATWAASPFGPRGSTSLRRSFTEESSLLGLEAEPVGWSGGGGVSEAGPWGPSAGKAGPTVDSAIRVFVTAADLSVCSSHGRRGEGVSADIKKNFAPFAEVGGNDCSCFRMKLASVSIPNSGGYGRKEGNSLWSGRGASIING